MKMHYFAVVFALAALHRLEAAVDVDPGLIALSPDEYVGRSVTIMVKSTKIDNRSESWEKQANLNTSFKINFIVQPLAEIKCYADRTRQNMKALAGLKRGKKLILTGAIRRYRMKVKTTFHQARNEETEREETGWRIRYAFIVETIARVE